MRAKDRCSDRMTSPVPAGRSAPALRPPRLGVGASATRTAPGDGDAGGGSGGSSSGLVRVVPVTRQVGTFPGFRPDACRPSVRISPHVARAMEGDLEAYVVCAVAATVVLAGHWC